MPVTAPNYKGSRHLIYGLIDPRTCLIFYVGFSNDGMGRPKKHRYYKNSNCWKCANYVEEMLGEGVDYEITVLEEVPAPKTFRSTCWWWSGINTTALSDSERWWVAFGRALGWPLTNIAGGGGGITGFKYTEEQVAKQRRTGLRRHDSGDLLKGIHSPEQRKASRIRLSSPDAPTQTPEARAKKKLTQADPEWRTERSRAAQIRCALKLIANVDTSHIPKDWVDGDPTPRILTESGRQSIVASQKKRWTPEQREALAQRNRTRVPKPTARQLALLKELDDENWQTPKMLGGSNASYHAGVLAELFLKGFADRENRSKGAIRSQWQYRRTEKGRELLATVHVGLDAGK